jgi:hypothetical protein
MYTHSQCSSPSVKTLADSSSEVSLRSHTLSFVSSLGVMVTPPPPREQLLFSFGNKIKCACSRSGEYGYWRLSGLLFSPGTPPPLSHRMDWSIVRIQEPFSPLQIEPSSPAVFLQDLDLVGRVDSFALRDIVVDSPESQRTSEPLSLTP